MSKNPIGLKCSRGYSETMPREAGRRGSALRWRHGFANADKTGARRATIHVSIIACVFFCLSYVG